MVATRRRPGRGRSGLHRAGCWLTASRGDPQDSATENRPPMAGPKGPAQVRVKRCGKSAPASGATRTARQTPPGARPSVGRPARPMSPGRPHRWMTTHPDPRKGPVDRTPPTGRLTVTYPGRRSEIASELLLLCSSVGVDRRHLSLSDGILAESGGILAERQPLGSWRRSGRLRMIGPGRGRSQVDQTNGAVSELTGPFTVQETAWAAPR